MPNISHDLAEMVLAASLRAARDRGLAMNVAVLDSGGHLKAFARMDGAWLGSIDLAIKKARTSCYFRMASGQLGEMSQPGGPVYGIESANSGLVTFAGGIPLVAASRLIGAIGVSGGTIDEDHAVAEAGASQVR